MEKQDFTLNYFGKNVAGTRQDNLYILQISYVPLHLERKVDGKGNSQWLDKEQEKETQLSKDVGRLLEEQSFIS